MSVLNLRALDIRAVRGEIALGATLVLSAGWLLTTLVFHRLLLRVFHLPPDGLYYGAHKDVLTAYLLPLLTCLWPLTASALCTIESLWRDNLIQRARLSYFGLGLALAIWCRWGLQTDLNNGHRFYFYGAPADSVQAAAYASILFPLAVAVVCVLVAGLRRTARI